MFHELRKVNLQPDNEDEEQHAELDCSAPQAVTSATDRKQPFISARHECSKDGRPQDNAANHFAQDCGLACTAHQITAAHRANQHRCELQSEHRKNRIRHGFPGRTT
jgi:hypothetical protein